MALGKKKIGWGKKKSKKSRTDKTSRLIDKAAKKSKIGNAPKRAPGEPLRTVYVGSMTLNAMEEIRAELCEYKNGWVLKLCRGYIDQYGKFTYTHKQVSLAVRLVHDLIELIRKVEKDAKSKGLLLEQDGE